MKKRKERRDRYFMEHGRRKRHPKEGMSEKKHGKNDKRDVQQHA